jgi:hypothetical protein
VKGKSIKDYRPKWEVSAEGSYGKTTNYAGDPTEALNFCAQILYVNTVMDTYRITVRYLEGPADSEAASN